MFPPFAGAWRIMQNIDASSETGAIGVIAAWVLVLLGLAPGMTFDRIGKARGVKVPDTEGQRDWVDMFRETTTIGSIHPA
jgi:hypothetical protein